MRRMFKTRQSRARENQGEGVRWEVESSDEHNRSDEFCLLQRTFSQFSIPASYDSHFALPALLMGISKDRRRNEKKVCSLPSQNISQGQHNSRKSHRKGEVLFWWLMLLVTEFGRAIQQISLNELAGDEKKGARSRRLLCWASLAQVSVRLTLFSGNTMLLGLVTLFKNRPLSSKEMLEEVLESKSGSFPLYYCHWMLSLKDYFPRRQKLGFQIFPYRLKIRTLFFHLFLLM